MSANLVFLTIAYGLSIGFCLFIGLTGGSRSPYIGISILTMFIPVFALLIVPTTLNEKPSIQWYPHNHSILGRYRDQFFVLNRRFF